MSIKKLVGSILLAVAVAGALGLVIMSLTTATATPAEAAGRCLCPQVYAPVTCDNGKTYSNQCVANCRHARNCVPAGTI